MVRAAKETGTLLKLFQTEWKGARSDWATTTPLDVLVSVAPRL